MKVNQALKEWQKREIIEEKVTDDIFSVLEVAEIFNLPKCKVYEMVRKQQIPGFRVGRIILFRKSELKEWYEELEWLSWI